MWLETTIGDVSDYSKNLWIGVNSWKNCSFSLPKEDLQVNKPVIEEHTTCIFYLYSANNRQHR